MKIWILVTVTTLLAGCLQNGHNKCSNDALLMIDDMLYFGTTQNNDQVDSDEWNEFLDSTVTPRFPQGLSHWPISGQWQTADGTVLKEDSYILNIVHDDDLISDQKIQEIIDSYKSLYDQQSVLRVRKTACVKF